MRHGALRHRTAVLGFPDEGDAALGRPVHMPLPTFGTMPEGGQRGVPQTASICQAITPVAPLAASTLMRTAFLPVIRCCTTD